NVEVYYQLGMAYAGTGDAPTAFRAFQKALEVDPNHTASKLRIAQLMAGSNDAELLKEAQTRLKAMLEGKSNSAETLNTLALTELKLGNAEGAIQQLELALAEAPAELASSLMLAETKLSLRDHEGAEQALKKACNEAPKSSDARRLLGEFY